MSAAEIVAAVTEQAVVGRNTESRMVRGEQGWTGRGGKSSMGREALGRWPAGAAAAIVRTAGAGSADTAGSAQRGDRR